MGNKPFHTWNTGNVTLTGMNRWRLLAAALIAALFVPRLEAVPSGQPSRTAIMAAVFRAVGARNPDAELRNPDYLAEKFIDSGDLDNLAKSGADYRPQMRLSGDDLVSFLKTS